MNVKDELFQEIERTPEGLLIEVLHFLRFIKVVRPSPSILPVTPPTTPPPVSTGRSLLAHLQTLGTWQGNDFEECLQSVYATRSQTNFDAESVVFGVVARSGGVVGGDMRRVLEVLEEGERSVLALRVHKETTSWFWKARSHSSRLLPITLRCYFFVPPYL